MSSKYNLIFLDTETTGNEEKDRLCQLSYLEDGKSYDDFFDELFKPTLDISIEAMAIHHITTKMVAGKPEFKKSPLYIDIKKKLEDDKTVIVAHNAKFDIGMLNYDDIFPKQYIDTLKIVRVLDPEMKIEKQNLQYLRYKLELDEEIDVPITAHDAKSDVIILEKLFRRLFNKLQEKIQDEDKTIEEMIKFSKLPTKIAKFTFGKHKGKKVTEVAQEDPGYLRWLLKQKKEDGGKDEDWIFTLEKALSGENEQVQGLPL